MTPVGTSTNEPDVHNKWDMTTHTHAHTHNTRSPRSRRRIWSREKGPVVPSHVSLLILHITQTDAVVLIGGIPPAFPDDAYLYLFIIPPTAVIGSVPSLSGHTTIANRWRSLPRVYRGTGSVAFNVPSNTGDYCLFFRYLHRRPIDCAPLFSRAHYHCHGHGTVVCIVAMTYYI